LQYLGAGDIELSMRIIGRKLLTAGLVALYGGISLLGYGLHELAPAHHHHAELGHSAHACQHCSGHEHCDPAANDDLAAESAAIGNAAHDSHECEICVFLAQMRSEQPLVVAEIAWQHFVADAVIVAPRIASQTILGLHIPRGPPTLVG
jgi:hypothetical protein